MQDEIKPNSFFKEHQDIIIPVIIAVSVVLLALILFLVTNKNNTDIAKGNDKLKAITEQGIVKNETYQGLEFSNITLIKEENIYTFTADVKNTSKETNKTMMVNIPIKDKKGNEIITLLGYIGKELAPEETTTITAATGADLSKAYIKEITERKWNFSVFF